MEGSVQAMQFLSCIPRIHNVQDSSSPFCTRPFWRIPRMFPRNENRNEGTFGCSPGTKNRMFPRNEKPERGYLRQNHPFTKPPFYLPVIVYTEQMDAEGLGCKLQLTPSGDPRRAPEKQTVGTVTTSQKMLTLQELSSSLNAGATKRGCLDRRKAFRCPLVACSPKTAACICTL